MQGENYLKAVRSQYEDYPFPFVAPEDDKLRLFVTPQDSLDKINHYCFRGQRDMTQGMRVLVAGGGTGNACIYLAEQLRDTDSEIVYLDMSKASGQIAKQRAKIRKLDNISWLHESILNIPKLELGKFDYINCTGVLHHLADPDAGLAALTSALANDGAMGLMVYGTYGRTGVYQIQALMQLVNAKFESASEKVALGKKVISNLPPSHWEMSRRDKRGQQQLIKLYTEDEINLYDTFLHEQDRAYTVPEVYAWLSKQDLQLNAFTHFDYNNGETLKYFAETFVNDTELLEVIHSYPLPTQQAIAELMGGNLSLHTFYTSKRSNTIVDCKALDNVPFFYNCHKRGQNIYSGYAGEEVYQFLCQNPEGPLVCHQPNQVEICLHVKPYSKDILRYIDGKCTLGEIIEFAKKSYGNQIDQATLLEEWLRIYKLFNRYNWLLLRHQSVPANKSYKSMQNPISALYQG